MAWTDERIASLRKLWADGLSASQIAKQLGGVSRNAVISKVHRMGLCGRGPSTQRSKPGPKPLVQQVRDRVKAMRAPVPVAVETQAQMRRAETEQARALPPLLRNDPIVAVKGNQCRYPYGDPLKDDFALCGRHVASHGPYCPEHARLCYTASVPRKRNQGGKQDGRMKHALAIAGGAR